MTADIHTLTGAYAANALPEYERVQFADHLAQCPACTEEVRELTETVTRLGMATAVTPPPALKTRILAEAHSVRQLPPLTPQSTPETSPQATVHQLRRTRATAILASVAAGFLAVAVGLGVLTMQAQDRARQLAARTQALETVLAAPDARLVTGSASTAGTGTVVMSQSTGKAVLVASGLPELPDSRAYQVWLIGPDGPRSAGLLEDTADEHAVIPINGDLSAAQRLGVTVEPAGGSAQPTTTPMLLLTMPT